MFIKILLVLCGLWLGSARAQTPPELVGRYQLEVQGGDILELRADGGATLAGETMRWAVRGRQLVVGSDAMNYVLQPDRLLLTVGVVQTSWKRLGAASRMQAQMAAPTPTPAQAPAPAPATAPPAANAGADPRDAQARQLLTGSAWCSFTYSKVSGTSTTRRVVFRTDGVMLVNGGAETYSSGRGGTVSSQSNNAGAMRWRLENLRLYVDPGDGSGFQDVNLTATQNSNGYPILNSLGREYSMCR
jgi:hypothetical protein